jgi:murein DD-endopeptidase MepM/ murein hydrolase activator NlpD
MIFQSPKLVALKIFSLLLLTACAQEPNYAPVKTVNEALEPDNGYIPVKPPLKASDRPDNIQQSVENLDKKQEISQTRQNSVVNGAPSPGSNQHKPSKAHPTDQALELTKNKSAKPVVDIGESSKPQDVAKLAQHSIDHPKNKSILSNTNDIYAQKKRHNNAKSLDNLQVTGKNNKKSIISIDNKKVLKLNFQWPLQGRLAKNFAQTDNKGILIKGKAGQSVHAAEAGKAVYCGQGLTGFGNLAIIKHNETYLSAYANNSKLTIKEGQQVDKGQTIGQVGLTGLRKSSLHFEIRKNGKPINPLTVLPKQ